MLRLERVSCTQLTFARFIINFTGEKYTAHHGISHGLLDVMNTRHVKDGLIRLIISLSAPPPYIRDLGKVQCVGTPPAPAGTVSFRLSS